MEDKFAQLQNSWNEAKKANPSAPNAENVLKIASKKHADSKKAHLMNVLTLVMVVLGLSAFFYLLAPMQDTLSRVGIGLMIGGLIIRIIIELISHRKAQSIDYSTSSKNSTHQALAFYNYRKKIHGPVTLTIIGLYTIGFYALTPEFSRYFSTFWMWMMDGSYVIIMVILFIIIRKGVVREMRDLAKIKDLELGLKED